MTETRYLAGISPGMPATDGVGVQLTRMVGTPQLDMVDPFLMLDRIDSDDPDSYIAGFPNHPHRGFETVTIMLEGLMRHQDSVGNDGLLRPGDVQWMTAGRGIIHSELPEMIDGRLKGFQLWVNLPAEKKMIPPGYQDIPAADISDRRVRRRIGTGDRWQLSGNRWCRPGADTDPLAGRETRPRRGVAYRPAHRKRSLHVRL